MACSSCLWASSTFSISVIGTPSIAVTSLPGTHFASTSSQYWPSSHPRTREGIGLGESLWAYQDKNRTAIPATARVKRKRPYCESIQSPPSRFIPSFGRRCILPLLQFRQRDPRLLVSKLPARKAAPGVSLLNNFVAFHQRDYRSVMKLPPRSSLAVGC